MFNKIVLFVLLTLPFVTTAKKKDEQQIRALLQAQVAEWNMGHIEGYMHGYWNNDSLLFIGSKGPRYGYATTLSKYLESYPDAAHMGQLTSKLTRCQRLSARYYFVVGTWYLERSAGNIGGSFTLLLRKIKGSWVIVADHSS